jgi:hypothetical protein
MLCKGTTQYRPDKKHDAANKRIAKTGWKPRSCVRGSQGLSLIWHLLTDGSTVRFREPVSRDVPTTMELVENVVRIG